MDNRLVLTIHGRTCDLTDFAHLHPGGKEILQHTKDATSDFEQFGHSDNARAILAGLSSPFSPASIVPAASTAGMLRTKLITHEDYRHLHKTLGVIALLHLLVRVSFTVVYGEDVMVHLVHPAWRSVLVVMQITLSLTSLQFHVPRTSSTMKPMIHQLFRAHSIIFAIRGAVCSLLLMWCGYTSCLWLRAIVVLLTLFAADWASVVLSDSTDKYTTTRAMPYWVGIAQWRQALYKEYYAVSQFGATLLCIMSHQELLPLSTLVAIQGAAFLQTLVRKSLISTWTYHHVYLAQLVIPPIVIVATLSIQGWLGILGLAWVLSIVRSRLHINKYLMWMVVGCGTVLYEHGLNLPLVAVVIVCATCCMVRTPLRSQPNRNSTNLDPNTRIHSITHMNLNHSRILLRTRDRLDGFQPGQYVTLSDGDRVRRYTPLSMRTHREQSSLVDLAVRRYPGPTFSDYMCTRSVGDVVVCAGPFGTKYYQASTRTLCSPHHVVQFAVEGDAVALFAGGSGVVPMYSLAVALLDANVQVTLVVSNTSEATTMLVLECQRLQSQHPVLLRLHTHVTELGTRLTRGDLSTYASGARVSCVCGPTNFGEFVKAVIQPLIEW